MTNLDAIDQAIIRQLLLNARISTTDLAAEVGLSPSSCLRRIRLLESSGAIKGYTAIVARGSPEAGMSVMVDITLERQTEDFLRTFETAVRKYPEIRECYLMTGGSDYRLRVEVESAAEFERVHTDILSTLPGVRRIHSSFAIRNVLATRARPRRSAGA